MRYGFFSTNENFRYLSGFENVGTLKLRSTCYTKFYIFSPRQKQVAVLFDL